MDIKKAFFQIRIRESERDAPRFLWLRDIRNKRIEILRFTQLDYKKYVRWRINFVWFQTRSFRTQDNCYSDIPSRRIQATQIPFQLWIRIWRSKHLNIRGVSRGHHKGRLQWYNIRQQLGTQPWETKILGLFWDKKEDSIAIEIPGNRAKHTKRETLSKLASIYNSLGLISPINLQGKVVYRELCELKVAWDKTIPNHGIKVWEKW